MSINIREAVEAQIADKIAKGEALAEKVTAAEDAAAALDAAQKDAAAARREALAAGWTETELKRLGLASTRTPRPRRTRTKSTDQTDAATASE